MFYAKIVQISSPTHSVARDRRCSRAVQTSAESLEGWLVGSVARSLTLSLTQPADLIILLSHPELLPLDWLASRLARNISPPPPPPRLMILDAAAASRKERKGIWRKKPCFLKDRGGGRKGSTGTIAARATTSTSTAAAATNNSAQDQRGEFKSDGQQGKNGENSVE